MTASACESPMREFARFTDHHYMCELFAVYLPAMLGRPVAIDGCEILYTGYNLPKVQVHEQGIIYGDFHLRQLRVCDDKVYFFDFDEFAMGDAMQDLAQFLVDLRLYRFTEAEIAAMSVAFIAAYESAVEHPIAYPRILWHTRAQLINKAYRFYKHQIPNLNHNIHAAGVTAIIWVGARQVLDGHMTPGDLLIFLTYLRNLYRPVRDMSRLSTRVSSALISAERISEILAMEPEPADEPNALAADYLRGAIVFDKVSFAYGNGRQILDQVSFHIAPGQRIALVGPSGSGKSTIVNLLLRLYEPTAGTITIDGVDIRRYRRESLRRAIGIVLQDTVLFGASIRDNIAYGSPDASPKDIEHAARQAHAHDFINALPAGYDTVLSERCSTLSGGERQRLCLARAFIKKPSILVLDEPTSTVDGISANLINNSIAQVQRGKTALVIAHQFHGMTEFDQILVLKEGRIVESGRHEQLLARKEHYYTLVNRQPLLRSVNRRETMKKPTLLFYCQHSLGMGHLVRSFAVARALTVEFEVVFLNGSLMPAGFPIPPERLNGPTLAQAIEGLTTFQPNSVGLDLMGTENTVELLRGWLQRQATNSSQIQHQWFGQFF